MTETNDCYLNLAGTDLLCVISGLVIVVIGIGTNKL